MKKNQIGILWLMVSMLAACGLREQQSQVVRPIAVEVQTMAEQVSVPRHTYVGEIEAQNSVSLSATTGGRVLAVYAERGERVRAGQVLLCIDSTQAVNARHSAEALLRQAEDGYSRACVLYKEGGLTEQKRVEIETQLQQARSMYASAARMVEDCRLTAPRSGVISECRTKVGETVAPGLPLFTVIDIDSFMVHFSVPETEIASIRVGDKARLQVPAADITNLPIVVTDKSLIPDRIAHTYEVKAALKDRSGLMPGMMAKVQLSADKITGFVLPQNTVLLLPDGAKVWIAEKGHAVRKNVTIGQYVSDGVLITEGLQANDKVIIKGYQKLWQGAEITY